MSVHGDAVAANATDAEIISDGDAVDADRTGTDANGAPPDEPTVEQATLDGAAFDAGTGAESTTRTDPPTDDPLSGPIHDYAVGNPPTADAGGVAAGPANEESTTPPGDVERVVAFHIGETYFFRHFFDDAVFASLGPYYDPHAYRFAVPASTFLDLRPALERRGYRFAVVEDPSDFVVLVPKYTAHPDNIFKESVAHTTVDGKNCFVMASTEAARRAAAQGAVRLRESGLELSFTDRATA